MLSKTDKKIVLCVLLTATILSPLDFYIVNLALTPIEESLNASASHLQMIISFYTSAYAVFQITGGRLGDLLGRKQMFILGLTGFILSSFMCGLASTSWVLITGRVLQGVSGAIMAPQILAIIHTVFTEKEQPFVMGLYSFSFGLAAVLGQLLGGVLISLNILGLGWKIVFLINLPIGLLALIGAIKFIPKQELKKTKEGIDWLGIFLLSLCLGLIIYPLTQGMEEGWSAWIVATMATSIPVFMLFVAYEKYLVRKQRNPLIDIAVFKSRNLVLGASIAFLFYCSGIFYLALGIYLQKGLGWTSVQAGFAIMPFGLGFILSSLISSSITKWIGNKVLSLGLFGYGLGFTLIIVALSFQNAVSTMFYTGLFIAGLGMGLTLSSIVRISLHHINEKFVGLASGVINSSLQIGSAIGVAAIGGLFFSWNETLGYAKAFQGSLLIVVGLLVVASILAYVLIHKTKAEE